MRVICGVIALVCFLILWGSSIYRDKVSRRASFGRNLFDYETQWLVSVWLLISLIGNLIFCLN